MLYGPGSFPAAFECGRQALTPTARPPGAIQMTTRCLLSLAAALLAASSVRATDPAKKPNVIVFLTDDNGYGDHSCHGNPVLKTPNFDKLHAQSVRLTDFHVAPMCTPTRSQLLTGMDCLHNGASSVSAGRSMVRRGI